MTGSNGSLGIEIYYTIGISVKDDISFDPDGCSWEILGMQIWFPIPLGLTVSQDAHTFQHICVCLTYF